MSFTVLLKIALRNLFRNKKRSLITLLAIGVGLGALLFLRGFLSGVQHRMLENITGKITSDLQILPRSQENFYNTNGAVENPDVVRRILAEDGRVQGYAEEILGGGLISSDQESMATFVVGLDPEREAALGLVPTVVKGRYLVAGDSKEIVIGEPMRKVLGVDLGAELVVTAQDYYGSMGGGKYLLVGTFETGNDQIDNGNAILLKPTVQDLLSFEHRVSRFLVKGGLKGGLRGGLKTDLNRLASDLRGRLSKEDLSVKTWDELLPLVAQLFHFQNGMIFVIVFIVFTVVAAGIMNTLLMSVTERVKEFGLMMALGTNPAGILKVVLLESFILTIGGILFGILGGGGLLLYFGHRGIDLSRFISTVSNFMIGARVFPQMDLKFSAIFVLLLLVASLVASAYPAWKASRLDPVEAMRQI